MANETQILKIQIDSAEATASLNRNQEAINALSDTKRALAKEEKELREDLIKSFAILLKPN